METGIISLSSLQNIPTKHKLPISRKQTKVDVK